MIKRRSVKIEKGKVIKNLSYLPLKYYGYLKECDEKIIKEVKGL